jgi:hypothetical protein
MSNGRPTATSPIDETRSRWAAHVRDAWPRVHVELVETSPCAAGRHVRAVVCLGGLTPADVVVGLTPGPVDGTTACSADRRMWSCESLDNGAVVFERLIPRAEDVAGGAWTVCVCPAAGALGRPVVYPLRLPPAIPAEPTGPTGPGKPPPPRGP